jgi:hypothetical protein
MSLQHILATLAFMLAALATGCGAAEPLEDITDASRQPLRTPDYRMPQNRLHPGVIDANLDLLDHVWSYSLTTPGFNELLQAHPEVASLFNTGQPTSAEYLMEAITSCALNSEQSVTADGMTPSHTWWGEFGLCSGPTGTWGDWAGEGDTWTSGSACWEIVAGCVLARMNALGKHVPISLRVANLDGHLREFEPATKVRVRTTLREGQTAGGEWQPEFVGICARDEMVTLQRDDSTKVRVCKGIHGCDPGGQHAMGPGSAHVYAGFVGDFEAGSGAIEFPCPTDVSTAPNGRPDRAYFSVMVDPAVAGTPSRDLVAPLRSDVPFVIYPATEQEVFTYPEGAFYGGLYRTESFGIERWACHSEMWQSSKSYFADRLCADPGNPQNCGLQGTSVACEAACAGRSPQGAYFGCQVPNIPNFQYYSTVTVFLNEPSAISSDPIASAIVPTHDECTPGAPLVDGSSPVVTSVCAVDPYCCESAWDSSCVAKVLTVAQSAACGPAPCGHSTCAKGAALADGCSPVVTSVCAVDPYCCSTEWDDSCVAEVQSVAGSEACACSHPVSTTGAALMNGCSPVATSVCAEDPSCCNTGWDDLCVDKAATVASRLVLGSAPCSHSTCTTGAALTEGCSPVVTRICAVDPYCCDVEWDRLCVDEVATVAQDLECVAGACGHTLCTTGGQLTSGCDVPPLPSSCVASICAVDSYCCDVAWDRICVGEVASVCGKTCGTCSDALQPTECAVDMMGFVNSLLGAVNAIDAPLATRTEADMLSCPADTGAGEGHLNVFSSVGPLPKSCNRVGVDDCADPARSNYWVSVVDERRAGLYESDPYSFRVIWGSEVEDYRYYGACSPDPNGFDNAAAGIPKLLEPVNDVDGDGVVGIPSPRHEGKRVVDYQNHVYELRFYVPDGNGGRTYIEKDTIAQISSPFLVPASIPLPSATSADHDAPYKSAYVAVNITPRDAAGEVFTALVENNYDDTGFMQWKQQPSCGGQ